MNPGDSDEYTQRFDDLPDDSSYEDIVREIVLARMIDRGLAASDARRVMTMTGDEMKRRLGSRRK